MCGLFGLFANQSRQLDVAGAFEDLAHRGPDGRGLYFEHEGIPQLQHNPDAQNCVGNRALGHLRLSILDLADRSLQPMRNPANGQILVFNGEIYNYLELKQDLLAQGVTLSTTSDTEVLLQGWAVHGLDYLRRLKGMFALALYDPNAETVTLARDFFGVKPLHYAIENREFAFASEVSALRRLLGQNSKSINQDTMFHHLRFGSTLGDGDTFLSEIKQVLPGEAIVVHLPGNRLEHIRFWSPNDALLPRPDVELIDLKQASDQCREMFQESIDLHLRSDVPVALTLSGGIDSSAIASMVRQLNPDSEISAFSFIADDPKLSEEMWIDHVANEKQLHLVKIKPCTEEIWETLDQVIKSQGEPFGSASILSQYFVMKAVGDAGFKVVLDGQGADEIFAGYAYYQGAALLDDLLNGRIASAAKRLLHAGSDSTVHWRQLVGFAANYGISGGLNDFFRQVSGRNVKPYWVNESTSANFIGDLELPNKPEGRASLHRILAHSQSMYGLPSLLRYQDRNSMAHSIESRVPFLLPGLSEFTAQLPIEHLISGSGRGKNVFRSAMKGLLPEMIAKRRDKIGFRPPESNWMKDLPENALDFDGMASLIPFIDPGPLAQRWRKFKSSEAAYDSVFFRLYTVQRWWDGL